MAHRHNDEERGICLTKMALNSGNVGRTRKELEADAEAGEISFEVPAERTLYNWRDLPEYETIRVATEKARDERQGDRMSAGVERRLEGAEALLDALDTAIEAKEWRDARDISTALRNLDTGSGILNQHSRINREKPLWSPPEHKYDYAIVDKAIQRLLQQESVPGEVVQEAEVVPAALEEGTGA